VIQSYLLQFKHARSCNGTSPIYQVRVIFLGLDPIFFSKYTIYWHLDNDKLINLIDIISSNICLSLSGKGLGSSSPGMRSNCCGFIDAATLMRNKK
jgi:hypothetical protein